MGYYCILKCHFGNTVSLLPSVKIVHSDNRWIVARQSGKCFWGKRLEFILLTLHSFNPRCRNTVPSTLWLPMEDGRVFPDFKKP